MLGLGFMAILLLVLLACHTNIVAPNGLILAHDYQDGIKLEVWQAFVMGDTITGY